MSWLDDYERHARLTPGLLALAPIALVLLGLGLRNAPVVASIASILTVVGGPILIAQIVRERGRRVQADIYRGPTENPTTALLRLQGSAPSDAVRQRRRRNVERVIGESLPSLKDEQSDPDHAASEYASVVAELRERTRDHERFPLVYAENRGFGFERNLLGMRPIGIVVAIVAAVLLALAGLAHLAGYAASIRAFDVVAVEIVTMGFASFWKFYPSQARVLTAGVIYAEKLLDATASL